MGGVAENVTKVATIDISSISALASNNISSFDKQPLNYKLKVTSNNLQLYIGSTSYSLAFDLSSYANSSDDSDIASYLNAVPAAFNIHIGSWYKWTPNTIDLS
jgi:hypothetical protein